MPTLRTISIKTQVRRLRYFSLFSYILGKRGNNLEFFRKSVDKWSENHAKDLKKYFSSTGEINPKALNKVTQSLRNYLEAAKSLSLINQEKGWLYPTRNSLILRSLDKEQKAGDAFSLSTIERVFFLYLLSQLDADRFFCVFEMLKREPGLSLRDYQNKFQIYYLNYLERKLKHTSKLHEPEILDALTRVKSWRSPERYSEDIVPPRINWWLDLGFIEPDSYQKNEIQLSKKIENLSNLSNNDFFSQIPILFEVDNVIFWRDLHSSEKEDLLFSYLQLAKNLLGVLNLPRLPLKETLLFLVFKLFQNNLIISEISQLEKWIGFERNIKGLNIGIRKSGRTYESYLYIKNG